jgi:hypothetical protein
MVDDEVGEDEETDPEIHCVGDTSPSPHLTQSAYEESLMDSQLNELSKGEKANENQNKYNLRSKKKEGKPSTSDHPNKTENYAKVVVSSSKEKEEQNSQTMIKTHVPEIKEILKSPSSF